MGLVKYVWGEPSAIHLKEAEFVKPMGHPPDPIPDADEQWIYNSINYTYTRIIWFKNKHVVLAIEENKSEY